MKKLFFLIIMFNVLNINAQKVFLDENYNPVKDSLEAKYYKITLKEKNSASHKETYYLTTGQKIVERVFNNYSGEIIKENKWHENGNLKSEILYSQNLIDGLLVTYWKNGNIKRKDYFIMGKYEKGTCYDSLGNIVAHIDYEIAPEYKGGYQQLLKAIINNLRYPEKAINEGIQGKVLISFKIKEDGTIADISVIIGLNQELDKEAMRVVSKLEKFKPGFREGEPASFNYNIPITFRLN